MKQTLAAAAGALILGLGIGFVACGNGAQDMQMSGGTMQGAMHDMNAELVGKTGDEFDQAFLAEMIVHHQGAVEMAQQVLTQSKRPELIALANGIIAAQTKEIAQMQAWQKEWFAR